MAKTPKSAPALGQHRRASKTVKSEPTTRRSPRSPSRSSRRSPQRTGWIQRQRRTPNQMSPRSRGALDARERERLQFLAGLQRERQERATIDAVWNESERRESERRVRSSTPNDENESPKKMASSKKIKMSPTFLRRMRMI